MVDVDESTVDFSFSTGMNFIIFSLFYFLEQEISISRWVGDVTGTTSIKCSVLEEGFSI